MDVERAVEHLQENVGRLRHDVSMLSAQLEIVRGHIHTKQDLLDDLRVLQVEARVAMARTEALETRAEQAEHLAQRIEADTIHRAELTDWRRAHRRFTWLLAAVVVFTIVAVGAGLFVHHLSEDRDKAQAQVIRTQWCSFLNVRRMERLTPTDRALADQAAKLFVEFGCHDA